MNFTHWRNLVQCFIKHLSIKVYLKFSSSFFRLGLYVFRRKTTDIKWHSHHITLGYMHQYDLSLMIRNLVTWLAVFVHFLHGKVTFPLPFTFHTCEKKLFTALFKKWRVSTSWHKSIYIKYLEIFCVKYLHVPPFISLFNHFFLWV